MAATAARVPDDVAWDFLDTTSTYRAFLAAIDRCANALAALGLAAGERILISMPTSPQGVIAFYAANKLGAVPALIHPLSTAPEIEHYLNASRARIALTLDAFYERFAAIQPTAAAADAAARAHPDYLSPLKRFGFWLTKGRKIRQRCRRMRACAGGPISWPATHPAGAALARPARTIRRPSCSPAGPPDCPRASCCRTAISSPRACRPRPGAEWREGHSILAILPIFHGFGLGVCVNAAFMAGGKSILVPMFSAEIVAKLLRTKRPNLLVGVPTLYDALTRDPSLAQADLSCLRATFSGADTLPRPVKERFEKLVAERGGRVKLLEGYGLTEAVTAIMATPLAEYREGSIGIPFPDMLAKICRVGTEEELPPGEEGEICVAGPAVMLGYLDDPEATRETLRLHADGRTWLHTGDLGKMDADGFFYFTVRLKRMIKSSGFNVYPAQVEAVLYQHPLVAEACVAGVPDPAQVERVQAFVVLKDPAQANADTERALIEHCRAQLIKWSCPRRIEFCAELPKTRVGKIDYKVLVQEHVAKLNGKEKN